MILPYRSIDNRAQRDEPGGGAIGAVNVIAANVQGNMELVSEISGVRETLTGAGGKSGESGALFEMKRESAQTGINPFFHNLSKDRRYMCSYFLDLAPEVYREHFRRMEVEGDNNNFVQAMINIPFNGDILMDIKKMKARATIDEGEKSTNYRAEMYENILTLMHVMTQAGFTGEMLPIHFLFDYLPMRNRDAMKDFIMRQMSILKEQKIASGVDARLALAAGGRGK